MAFARCPLCEDILNLGDAFQLNQPITCPTCLSNLRVVSTEPLELDEASRRPARPVRQNYPPGKSQGYGRNDSGDRSPGVGNRPVLSQTGERRPFPPLPPNPDKQVDGRRAQKWERPKEDESDEDPEAQEYDELEEKLLRNRSGKGKRGK